MPTRITQVPKVILREGTATNLTRITQVAKVIITTVGGSSNTVQTLGLGA